MWSWFQGRPLSFQFVQFIHIDPNTPSNVAKCRFIVGVLGHGLKIAHFSTHSLRKTFGRRVVEMAGPNAETALIKLSDIFQHSSVKITRIYLGLRKEELLETYDMLQM